MIRTVSFYNFKAYRSLDVELEPLTVLVGPNASGKTTLLEGMLLATGGASEGLGEKTFVEMTQGNLLTREAKPPVEISLAGAWGDIVGKISLSGRPGAPPKSTAVPWRFTFSGELNGEAFPVLRPGAPVGFPPSLHHQAPKLRAAMKATAILRFEPRRLAEASYSEDEVPRVSSDGSGLASVLAHLKLTDDSRFNAIESELTRIVPAVEKIRVERAAVEVTLRALSIDEQRHEVPERRTLWGNRIVFDMQGAQGVSADAAGEGTLMALGRLTVVMGPGQPKLVLLDDIELALHPVAQGKLVEAIRKLQKQNPELQIVATSHSPFILNYLDPKEVRMTFLAENGFARCEKLTAHPEFEKWKDLMSPGEFWSTVGESWLEKVGETSAHE